MSLLLLIKFSSLRFILYFDYLGDDFPFDWVVKCFQKENVVDIFNCYSRNCLFPTLLFLQKSKNSLQTLYMCIWPILT